MKSLRPGGNEPCVGRAGEVLGDPIVALLAGLGPNVIRAGDCGWDDNASIGLGGARGEKCGRRKAGPEQKDVAGACPGPTGDSKTRQIERTRIHEVAGHDRSPLTAAPASGSGVHRDARSSFTADAANHILRDSGRILRLCVAASFKRNDRDQNAAFESPPAARAIVHRIGSFFSRV
jgi:hypothetical protein